MWPCCGSRTCVDVCLRGQDDQNSIGMDVELLKEQYRWRREKQRRETQVICFRTVVWSPALDSAAVNGTNAVVCQIRASVPESASDWLTDLDVCRSTYSTGECVIRHTADSDTHTEGRSSSSGSEWRFEDSSRRTGPSSRKFSAPAALSQSYRSTPVVSRHYPFPQRKSLRKSETARRLGLYASL